ncbi:MULTISPECIES: TRAP transporter small permease [Roseobacteraceae]|uniref:TRAP transporter small permease protein n=1 Tax=Pseudosulfitobacter pseudonitzschiae TaxID=1402135 RepID=A0A221K633_9RHOB|nr:MULTISPECIES: TRAP transporter small permease subunit [Roseobacteraceae]ASM74464.1 tripartite ATP-independent periplasmic transporter, DctQ component [Pseudosulfitobacter pseudonitzschiae]
MRHAIVLASNSVHEVTRRIAVLAVCLMFLTVMLQIIARYIFSAPPIWTEDVARYAMVWTGLLGATMSFKTRSDAVLMQSIFPRPPHVLAVLAEAIQSAAVLIFVLPVVYFCFMGLRGGFSKGYLARQSGLTTDTLGIPMVWISVSVPLAMLIILLHLAARWADNTVIESTETHLD